MNFRDLEHHNLLLEAASAISVGKSLIMMFFDINSLPMVKHTHRNLARINVEKHTLFISDSFSVCDKASFIENCYWSSQILWNAPSKSDVMKLYWDGRFRFYFTKKKYLLKLINGGFSVLQADVDTIWNANPLPILNHLKMSMIFQWDSPFANAGMLYAKPSASARWILEELSWRIQLFQNHPEIIPRVVKWSKMPYYSNSDDQTLLNDVIMSFILNQSLFTSTARWEDRNMKRHGGYRVPFTNRSEFITWQKSVSKMRSLTNSQEITYYTPCSLTNSSSKNTSWQRAGRIHTFHTTNDDSIAIAPNWLIGHFPHKTCRYVTHLSRLRGASTKFQYIEKFV